MESRLQTGDLVGRAAAVYVYLSAVACLCAAAHRLLLVLHPERRGVLASNHTSRVDLSHHDLNVLDCARDPTAAGAASPAIRSSTCTCTRRRS